MMKFPLRPAAALLSRKAFKNNVHLLQKRLKIQTSLHGANTKMMAVVKANAYGHGSWNIVEELQKYGVEDFCVASMEEGVELRKRFKSPRILVLGGSFRWNQMRLDLLKKNKLDIAINDLESLRFFYRRRGLRLHIKLDTGMNRLGLKPDQWPQMMKMISEKKAAPIEGLFTHLANFEGVGFQKQIELFGEAIQWFESKGFYPPVVHLENSAALFSPDLGQLKKNILSERVNMARPGLSLYGYLPANHPAQVKLDAVLQLVVEVGMLKNLKKGEGVGYDHLYRATKPHTIGILPIGYADGVLKRYGPHLRPRFWHQSASSKGRLELCGSICMDMVMLRSFGSALKKGQKILLWGKGASELVDKKIADPYELNLSIAKRIPRFWINA